MKSFGLLTTNSSIRKYDNGSSTNSFIKRKLIIQHKIIQKDYTSMAHIINLKSSLTTKLLLSLPSPPKIIHLINTMPTDASVQVIRNRPNTSKVKMIQTNSSQRQVFSKNERCKSAFSRMFVLKNAAKQRNPDRLFSSVSFLFDRKNSVSMNSISESSRIQKIGTLKVQGVSTQINTFKNTV